jgi:quercetin dioxygenase-like cupin family protein
MKVFVLHHSWVWLSAVVLMASSCASSASHVAGANSSSPVNSSAGVATASAGKIRRTLIQKAAAPGLPGWETRLYLVEYGPGAVAPPHIHPAVGIGMVLDGNFESAFGDEPVTQIHAGQSFVDPAGVPHRLFRNPSPEHELRFIIAYTIRSADEQFYSGVALPQ